MIEFFTGWWQYSFMRSAFLAVMIITPQFGILGTMIVNRKMAFFSDALGHSALTGIAVGVVLGVTDTNLSMVIFAIIFALLLNKISSKSTASTDTIISVFSSCSVAIGLAILSKGGNFSKYSSMLVGDILSITHREIVYLVLIFLPAASSRNLAVNLREYHFFAVLFSMFSGILGLIISYFTNVATGPMIIIVASLIYFITFAYQKVIHG